MLTLYDIVKPVAC